MIKILYRAKSLESESYYDVEKGQWLYGLPAYFTEGIKVDGIEVSGEGLFKIDPNTISRCINLIDDNGNQIFANDVVRVCSGEFCQGVWEYDYTIIVTDYIDCNIFSNAEHVEIIGNIIDNPFLFNEFAESYEVFAF